MAKSAQRSQRGQGITEAAVALILIVSGIVAGVLFLLDVGASVYWKGKIGFVTTQVALYAASLGPNPDQGAVLNFARNLLPLCGVRVDGLTVRTESVLVDGKKAVKVKLENTFPLAVTGVNYLPFNIRLTDEATALVSTSGTGGGGGGGGAVAFLYFEGRIGDAASGAAGGQFCRFKVPVVDTATTSVGGSIVVGRSTIPQGAAYYWNNGTPTPTPQDNGAAFILPGG